MIHDYDDYDDYVVSGLAHIPAPIPSDFHVPAALNHQNTHYWLMRPTLSAWRLGTGIEGLERFPLMPVRALLTGGDAGQTGVASSICQRIPWQATVSPGPWAYVDDQPGCHDRFDREFSLPVEVLRGGFDGKTRRGLQHRQHPVVSLA